LSKVVIPDQLKLDYKQYLILIKPDLRSQSLLITNLINNRFELDTMSESNKKQKLSEPLVLQPRLAQIMGQEMPMLTIAPEARDGKTKQEYFASLTEEAKDKIHAQAFRFLMAEIKKDGGDDLPAYYLELVEDVTENAYPWGDASHEEKVAADKAIAKEKE
jgi:hypothetical protein